MLEKFSDDKLWERIYIVAFLIAIIVSVIEHATTGEITNVSLSSLVILGTLYIATKIDSKE